jgi:hypothetical protein
MGKDQRIVGGAEPAPPARHRPSRGAQQLAQILDHRLVGGCPGRPLLGLEGPAALECEDDPEHRLDRLRVAVGDAVGEPAQAELALGEPLASAAGRDFGGRLGERLEQQYCPSGNGPSAVDGHGRPLNLRVRSLPSRAGRTSAASRGPVTFEPG